MLIKEQFLGAAFFGMSHFRLLLLCSVFFLIRKNFKKLEKKDYFKIVRLIFFNPSDGSSAFFIN